MHRQHHATHAGHHSRSSELSSQTGALLPIEVHDWYTIVPTLRFALSMMARSCVAGSGHTAMPFATAATRGTWRRVNRPPSTPRATDAILAAIHHPQRTTKKRPNLHHHTYLHHTPHQLRPPAFCTADFAAAETYALVSDTFGRLHNARQVQRAPKCREERGGSGYTQKTSQNAAQHQIYKCNCVCKCSSGQTSDPTSVSFPPVLLATPLAPAFIYCVHALPLRICASALLPSPLLPPPLSATSSCCCRLLFTTFPLPSKQPRDS